MKNQHTKGPWRVDGIPPVSVIDNEFYHIADCSGGRTIDSDEANARLIAAAPELLAACEAVENVSMTMAETLTLVRQAIAKAKGGEA